MIVRPTYIIPHELYQEAHDYAEKSKAYTSDAHDFHEGGLKNKKKKMLEGKLGEKAFKLYLIDNKLCYIEDPTNFYEKDEYDFLVTNSMGKEFKVDVKTRTQEFHIRTLEMVKQAENYPKDIYVSARLYDDKKVELLGWFSYNDMIRKNCIENHGYKDNYVMYDEDLRSMETLYQYLK